MKKILDFKYLFWRPRHFSSQKPRSSSKNSRRKLTEVESIVDGMASRSKGEENKDHDSWTTERRHGNKAG